MSQKIEVAFFSCFFRQWRITHTTLNALFVIPFYEYIYFSMFSSYTFIKYWFQNRNLFIFSLFKCSTRLIICFIRHVLQEYFCSSSVHKRHFKNDKNQNLARKSYLPFTNCLPPPVGAVVTPTEMADFSDGLKCSVAAFAWTSGRLHDKYPKESEVELLSDCTKDICSHLKTNRLNSGYRSRYQNRRSSDCQSCGNIFRNILERMTVSPFHRYSLVLCWQRQKATKCSHLHHAGYVNRTDAFLWKYPGTSGNIHGNWYTCTSWIR